MLLPAAMLLFAYLLLNAVERLDWADIKASLLKLEAAKIWGCIALTAATYGVASAYEVLSKRHERHAVRARSCLCIGFVAYAIAANLSALLGNWGVRYRLYARKGIGFRQTTRLAITSISTNWSGFVLLAGLVFLLLPPQLPLRFPIHEALVRGTGAVLLACTVTYLVICIRRPGQRWQLRGIRFTVPIFNIALLQLLLSGLVWLGIASVIHHLLPAKAPFHSVLAVLFLSTLAGLVIRAPAGVGVTEVVFVSVLGPTLGTSAVVAALLAYRAVFQLLPVLLAASLYLLLELQWRQKPTSPQPAGAAPLGIAR